ncbi:MAG TPA: choice-of-anchor D domain-containing protein [Verrucomicrobiae bacterium]|nr:choice-of-anchor D domain-containing protein [Verrucomicrobiae bacterium]
MPTRKEFSAKTQGPGFAGLLLTIALGSLIGCQGISAGGASSSSQAGTLAVNPASEDFGIVKVGSHQAETLTITNTGATPVSVSQISLSGNAFELSGISVPLNLSSSQTSTFTVTFAPQASGAASGTVTIKSDGTNPTLNLALSGTGTTTVGQLSITPATIALGSVAVGTSNTASGSLSASGANVTVTTASLNNSAFSLSGLSLPATVTAGHSVAFTVTFTPEKTGAANASLTFTSNAQTASIAEILSGTGIAATTYSVRLVWEASTSPNIAGYNVYRASFSGSCGSFSKINSLLNTGTTYTDAGVAGGASYCYATTAVNARNEESGYSNIVSNIQVPTP